jgi:replicative superfamily II helicase
MSSIEAMKEVADEVHKKLKKTSDIDNDFQSYLYNSDLAKKEQELLTKFAAKGIFLHYSSMPYKIRKWVEDFFRKEENTKKILFATETLFYGVNISTDCVILAELEWPREDIKNPLSEPVFEFLTVAQYHNILGRVGRPNFNHDDNQPHAYICVRAKDFNSDYSEKIIGYYKKPSNVVSKLFLSTDRTKWKNDQITDLNDISYSAFRAVSDAIRYLGSKATPPEPVSKKDINSLLRKTVFANSDKDNFDFISEIVDVVIQQGCKYRFKDVSSKMTSSLIEEIDGRYKITSRAESLIITGTHWKSIAPMYSWLLKISEYNESYPIETLVPALIAAPDLWRLARTFCGEHNKNWEKQSPTNHTVDANQEKSRELLYEEIYLLFNDADKANNFIQLMDDYAEQEKSILVTHQSQFRKAMFFKLTAAFLKWLRGEEMDAISKLSFVYKGVSNSNLNSNALTIRYVEKANWLAIMMLNFFEEATNMLSPHQIRELPTLSLRLRYGVVSDAIPYKGGFGSSDYQLERSQIRELLNKGITPTKLIKSYKNVIAEESCPTELIRKAHSNTVLFFQQQVNQLSEIFSDEGSQHWKDFVNLFSSNLKDDQQVDSDRYAELLQNLLSIRGSKKFCAITQTDPKK